MPKWANCPKLHSHHLPCLPLISLQQNSDRDLGGGMGRERGRGRQMNMGWGKRTGGKRERGEMTGGECRAIMREDKGGSGHWPRAARSLLPSLMTCFGVAGTLSSRRKEQRWSSIRLLWKRDNRSKKPSSSKSSTIPLDFWNRFLKSCVQFLCGTIYNLFNE